MRARVQISRTARSRAVPDPDFPAVISPHSAAAVELLLQRSARGNRTAFAELYDIMAVPVYMIILARAANGPQAERLVLAVFLGLWERCPLYPQRSHSAVPWILAYAEQTADYAKLLPAQQP